MNSVKYSSSPATGITWLDHAASPFLLRPSWMQQHSMPEHRVPLQFSPLRTFSFTGKWLFLIRRSLGIQLHHSEVPPFVAKLAPSFWLHGMITRWSCPSCCCVVPEPCLGIFACQTCVDWTEEQRLHVTNRRTYHKKTVSSPTSELDNLLVVDNAEPVIPSPGPSNSAGLVDATLAVPVPHQSSLESLLVGFSTQLTSLTATLRGEKGRCRRGPCYSYTTGLDIHACWCPPLFIWRESTSVPRLFPQPQGQEPLTVRDQL